METQLSMEDFPLPRLIARGYQSVESHLQLSSESSSRIPKFACDCIAKQQRQSIASPKHGVTASR